MGSECWTFYSGTSQPYIAHISDLQITIFLELRWLVPSRQPGSRLEEKPRGSSWLPRLLGSPHPLLVESRSPTGTDPAQSLSARFVATRNLPSYSSASFPSSVSSGRSPRISRLTFGSRALPLWLFRRLARRIWSVFSRIPTFVLSMPSESPLCLRTSSWRAGSVENALRIRFATMIVKDTFIRKSKLYHN